LSHEICLTNFMSIKVLIVKKVRVNAKLVKLDITVLLVQQHQLSAQMVLSALKGQVSVTICP